MNPKGSIPLNKGMETTTITPETAGHVLYAFGYTSEEPDAFTSAMLSAIMSADPGNKRLVATQYPEYVAAIDLAQNTMDGIEQLMSITARVPVAA